MEESTFAAESLQSGNDRVRPRWCQTARRAVSIVACCAYLVASLVPLFYGVLAFEVRCSDTCGQASNWLADANAWQWLPAGLLAIGVFVAAVMLLGGTIVRSRGVAGAALMMTALSWTGLGLLALTGR